MHGSAILDVIRRVLRGARRVFARNGWFAEGQFVKEHVHWGMINVSRLRLRVQQLFLARLGCTTLSDLLLADYRSTCILIEGRCSGVSR